MTKSTIVSFLTLVCLSFNTKAQDDILIQRAVSCNISDEEVSSLMEQLRETTPEMKHPVKEFAAPTFNLYKLNSEVSIGSFHSNNIIISAGRILLLLANTSKKTVINALELKDDTVLNGILPASRDVGQNRQIVAYTSPSEFPKATIVGCQYAIQEAATWPNTKKEAEKQASFFDL